MYVLHYAPDNASGIVRVALEEMGLPYRTALVDRAARAQHGPAYRAINPLGRIPALETAEGPIFETGAILLWLSEAHGGLAPAPGAPGRGRYLTWLFYLSNTLHADLLRLFYPLRYVAPAEIAGHHARMADRIAGHFAQLDRVAAEGDGAVFRLATDTAAPGLIDIYTAFLIRWSVLYPYDGPRWFDAARVPHLQKMALRLEARPSARAVAAAEGLGPTPFSAPRYPEPPEGSAT